MCIDRGIIQNKHGETLVESRFGGFILKLFLFGFEDASRMTFWCQKGHAQDKYFGGGGPLPGP